MKGKRYKQYKSSSIDCLGDIPEHWEKRRIRHCTSSIKNGTVATQVNYETDYRVTRIETISKGIIDYEKIGYVEYDSSLDEYRLEKTDILLSHINSLEMVGNCAIFEGGCDLYSGMNLLRLRVASTVEPFFLYWWLKSMNFVHAIQVIAKPAINQVSVPITALKDIVVPFPTLPEQRGIAIFLDRETSRIDELIEKKQRQIDLLQEKRLALVDNAIHHPLTRDFRMRHVADHIFRPIDRRDDDTYTPIGLYNRGRGIFHKETTTGGNLGDSDFFWVAEDDLILSGQFAWEGAIALTGETESGCIASHRYPILRGKTNIMETAYLFAFFTTKTGDFLLNENSRGAAGRNRPLNMNTLMRESIPVPPIEIQTIVSNHVYFERRIEQVITKSVSFLQEYRSALISAAVTGKIEVTEEIA